MNCNLRLVLLVGGLGIALQAPAQLATKVAGTGNYGKLFTNGSTLYELAADTLNAIDTTTGARTFLSKLPAAPGSNYINRWGSVFAVKTSNGFLLTQELLNQSSGLARTVRVWAGTGTGAWDTLVVTSGTYNPSEPLKLGVKYAFYVPAANGGGQMLRTDGTPAGTSVAFTVGSYPNINISTAKRGADRIFFGVSTGAGLPGTYPVKVAMMDDTQVQYLDSSSNTAMPLAAMGNDFFYDYKHQSGTPLVTVHSLKKWTTSGASVLVANAGTLTAFAEGTTFNGKLLVQKLDSAHNAADLVSIDPATGVQTYLTATPAGSYFPIYFLSAAGYGTAHLYIPQGDSGGKQSLTVTDGTMAGTHRIFTAATGGTYTFPKPGSYGPAKAIICNDEVYGAQYPPAGTANLYNVQLYHLDVAGTPTHQDLNTSVNGSDPGYFVRVSGTIFFTAAQATAQNYTSSLYDLWKLTACASSVTPPPPPPSAVDALAPDGALRLYPNPATDAVRVLAGAPGQPLTLELYDATGRRVLRQNVQSHQPVSTASLPAGVYLWRAVQPGVAPATGRLSLVR